MPLTVQCLPSSAKFWTAAVSFSGWQIDTSFALVYGDAATAPPTYSAFDSPTVVFLGQFANSSFAIGAGGTVFNGTSRFNNFLGAIHPDLWWGLFPGFPSGSDAPIFTAGPFHIETV